MWGYLWDVQGLYSSRQLAACPGQATRGCPAVIVLVLGDQELSRLITEGQGALPATGFEGLYTSETPRCLEHDSSVYSSLPNRGHRFLLDILSTRPQAI
jgi:hypothetical protein